MFARLINGQGRTHGITGMRHLSCGRAIYQKSNSTPIFDHTQLNPISKNSKKTNSLQMMGSTTSTETDSSTTTGGFKYAFNPREDAMDSKLTGVLAGRTVDVYNNDIASAFRQLSSKLTANNIAVDRRTQRFYMKPGKVAELKKSQRHRREFMMGFKRLMDIVKDAKRKGY
ncbi:hypothetical protein Kpol_1045p18 [Vanderwaltozyma polyspora DSM 70294]|uniref:Ribosomal protein S21 n=1 Tax=Vanderwaltozyma polyspora (strain ATCC 22028 / DSM 70294 / BCRC 21397 / CBS 2163 / NBRC 10782 / NRRL Y-8283 / UCD 57-17) TaxID=436907 RepID=A7TI26_VANPO|nr:uncharacterized protein Kpol_1045p18 [Vanderwaltozyma polyspora DSM 70294]EDO18033.1 hypothetical protein Kpol_1045p18 [Vanderwaltozyma polyspora DSM 70294]